MSKQDSVLIVGAGPTGLVLALALLQRGIPVRIIDEKAGPSVHSKAFGIHARTLEVFEKLGVVESFLEKGCKTHGIIFHRDQKEFKLQLAQKYLNDTPYPFVLMLPQSETEQILIEALHKLGCKIEWNTKLVSLDQFEFNWLIGCDGGRSIVRHLLDLTFEGAELPETFLIVDVEGNVKIDPSFPHFFLSSKGRMGLIPFKPSLNRLIFPFYEQDNEELTLPKVHSLIQKRGGDCLVPEKIVWFSFFKIHRRMVQHMRAGNCFLAGDAAHIHSPAGGQGMNTGIQDAFNLAWKLAYVIKRISSPQLLDSYEQERLPIAKKVLKGTTLFTEILAYLNSPGRLSLFFTALSLVKTLAGRKLIRNLTQLAVIYDKSSLTNKCNPFWRGPKSGERAPNVTLKNGKTLFDYLKGVNSILLTFQDHNIPQHEGFNTIVLHDENLMKAYHATKNSCYFIRPDGVIGYRSRTLNKKKLENYLAKIFK